MSVIAFAGRNVGSPWHLFGELEDGDHRLGLSDGSWSLVDAIREICEQTGPQTRLTLAVWTAGTEQLRALKDLQEQKYFTSIRILIDRSMPSRDKQATDTLKKLFGLAAIRVWSSHAKFAIFTGGNMPVLLLTSANLARNRNIEDWSVHASGSLTNAYMELAKALWMRQGAQQGFSEPARARHDTAAALGPPEGMNRNNALIDPAAGTIAKPDRVEIPR